jgi:hypothetical protein
MKSAWITETRRQADDVERVPPEFHNGRKVCANAPRL